MGLVGRPWTMHEIGLPTYWVAVTSNEHVNSSTVVKWLCKRNSTESVTISCRFRYLLNPPSSLYMIASGCCYRATRTTSSSTKRLPKDEDHLDRRRSCRAPATTSTSTDTTNTTCDPQECARLPLLSADYEF